MSEKKLTKRDVLGLIADAVKGNANEAVINEYIEKEIDLMDKRVEKDYERRLAKRAQGTEEQQILLTLVTSDYQTVDDLRAALEAKLGKEVTQQSVVAKLRNLVDTGSVIRENVETAEGTKRKAYRLA